MVVNAQGLRASDKKKNKLTQYPTRRNEKEIENFLYLTTYLKTLISGRTEHARVMKEAVKRSKDTAIRKKGNVVGFEWGRPQQESFEFIKKAV